MKKLKRIGLLMLTLVITIGFAGCGNSKKAEKPKPKPKPTYTAKQIMTKLKKDYKLPIVQEKTYNEKDDPNQKLGRPNQYISKSNWNDKRDKENIEEQNDTKYQKMIAPKDSRNCTVETFKTKEDAKRRSDFLSEKAKNMPDVQDQYVYLAGKAVLRISYKVAPSEAKKYEKAFYEIMEVKK